MHYTIAIMEDVQNDITINFDKVGDGYLVGLRNEDNSEYTKKIFKVFIEAKSKYFELVDAIIEGCYSYEQRKEMLK